MDTNEFHSIKIKDKYFELIGQKLDRLTIIGVPFVLPNYTLENIRETYVIVECDCGDLNLRRLGEIYSKGKLKSRNSRGKDKNRCVRSCCKKCSQSIKTTHQHTLKRQKTRLYSMSGTDLRIFILGQLMLAIKT